MSKKPVPSKKQAPSSTGSRHGAYVRVARKKLTNKLAFGKCSDCGATKLAHFVCKECGKYNGKQVIEPKKLKIAEPVQEIAA